MAYEGIEFDAAAPVATIRLNRPEAMNALTVPMLESMAQAVAQVAANPAIRVLVITGNGKAFSAGVDLKALGQRSLAGGAVGDYLDIPARGLITAINALDAIVIAAVNGFCFTGALELALACDLLVTTHTAKFGDTHAKWGLRPSWGMSQRLARLAGAQRARMLSYSAMTFTGEQAAQWGIAAAAVPSEEFTEYVHRLATDIAGNSMGALLAYKDLYRYADSHAWDAGLAYEATTGYVIDDTESRIAEFRS